MNTMYLHYPNIHTGYLYWETVPKILSLLSRRR